MDYETQIEKLAARGAQFTIAPSGQVSINARGVVVIDHLGEPDASRDFAAKPVACTVQPDLTLTLHGERFTAAVKLTPADALEVAAMLRMFAQDAPK